MLWKVSQVSVHGWIRLQGGHFSRNRLASILAVSDALEALMKRGFGPQPV